MTAAVIAGTRPSTVKVQATGGSVTRVMKNGVYTLIEVRRPDATCTRFRVPSRSMSDRIAHETAMSTRAKTAQT